MCRTIKGLATAILLICVVVTSYGQATRSPFSQAGVGDLVGYQLAHNQGNGGLGMSNGSYWHLNNINPALLPYNSMTVFAAGFVGARRNVTNGEVTESFAGGNLNYLATAFPAIRGKWTTSFGLMPYSNVDYAFEYIANVQNAENDETAFVRESGEGGFNQFYWSNGYAFNKNFSAGLRIGYLFSSITKKFSSTIDGTPYSPNVTDRVAVSDFMIGAGVAFTKDSIFQSPVRFNIGVTYDKSADISATRFQTFDRNALNGIPIDADTLINDAKGSVTIPQALGFGISFNRGLRWLVGLDFRTQKWSAYRDFSGENGVYDDSWKVTLGGELTPDPTSVTSYFSRVTYKLGFSYENTPYVVDFQNVESQVKDFGINFGWSLPVGRYSNIDMAFRYGKRGNSDETVLEENYYRVYLGLTFNDQWFIKRRYD